MPRKTRRVEERARRRMVTKCPHLAKKESRIRSRVRMTRTPPELGTMPQTRT